MMMEQTIGTCTQLFLQKELCRNVPKGASDNSALMGSLLTPTDSEHDGCSITPDFQLRAFDFNFNQTHHAGAASDNSSVCDNLENGSEASRNNSGRFLLRERSQRKLVPDKIRLKRQTLQDMARPLKHWLYRHRENPYPSKTEKLALARLSKMTLIQVSNWFANARRRLKNTVRDPDLNWAARIKMYNNCAIGNAELFSISSDDSLWDSDDESEDQRTATFRDNNRTESISQTTEVVQSQTQCSTLSRAAVAAHASQKVPTAQKTIVGDHTSDPIGEDYYGGPAKYKHTILQRYLNDSFNHSNIHLNTEPLVQSRYRRQSGSLGSRDYEEMSTSSGSTPIAGSTHGVIDDLPEEVEVVANKRRRMDENGNSEDYKWKEISAALALTSLAQSRKDSM